MKDEDNCIIKERITVATYLLDNSHIALLSSVNKIVRFLRENHQFLPLRLMVHLWKDGCTAKFHSRYTFSLFTHFYVWLQIAWYYNKPYYDKSPMDGIKRVIFTNVKVKKGLTLWKSFQTMQTKGLIASHRCTCLPIKSCTSQNRSSGFKNAGGSEN